MFRFLLFTILICCFVTNDIFAQNDAATRAKTIFDDAEKLFVKNTPEAFAEATPKFLEALKLWQEIGDERSQILALNKLVDINFATGDFKKVLEYSNLLLPITQKLGEKNVEGGVLGNLAWSYHSLGDTRTGLKYMEKSAAILHEIGEKQREGVALSGIGMMNSYLGEVQLSLDYFNRSLLLRRETNDKRGEAMTLINIGKTFDEGGNKRKALEIYEQALKLALEVKYARAESIAVNNIGSVWHDLGEFQKAFDAYQKSLELYRQAGNKPGEANQLTNLAALSRDLGDFENALKFIIEATDIFQKSGFRREEALTISSHGTLLSLMGDKAKALEYFQKSLEIHKSLESKVGKAGVLRNIGRLYFEQNEFQKASENFQLALSLAESVGDAQGISENVLDMARTFEKLNKPDEAEAGFIRALKIQRESNLMNDVADALYYYAKFEEKNGRRNSALEKMAEAMQIIEDLRNSIIAQNLRLGFLADRQKYFDLYIGLLVSQHKSEPQKGFDALALQISESARARSLLESVGQSQGDIRSGVSPELLEKEKVLRQTINAKESQRADAAGQKATAKAAEFEKEIGELLNKYRNLQTEIRRQSPQYASLTNPEPVKLNEIQTQILDENSILLEYFLGEERSFLFAVSKTDLKIYELPKRAEIEKTARKFYAGLRERGQNPADETLTKRQDRLEKADNDLENSAVELSRILLAPVAQDIHNKRLLIVASEILQYISFASLTSPKSKVQSPKSEPPALAGGLNAAKNPRQFKIQSPNTENRFLIETNEIVYLPSASTLAMLRKSATKSASDSIAVLADPVFATDDLRLKTIAKQKKELQLKQSGMAKIPSVLRGDLGRLKFSRQEAEAISSFLPENKRLIALDFKADLATAKSAAIQKARIIHFATHGFVRSDFPELSGVVFSLVNENGEAQDGYLRLHEIYNLDLNAELVVLSACETALGKDIKGEGLVGLTHGFLTAGSSRVVASLWRVDDKATAELMRRFYQAMLKENLRPAEALRKAQVSMLQDANFKHPFYWAAFTLQGEYR